MSLKKRNGLLLISVMAVALVTPAANATLSIRIFDGSDYSTAADKLTLSDDGTGLDLVAGDGVLNYSTSNAALINGLFGTSYFAGPFGSFDDVTINARGVAKLSNPWADALDLNSLDVSGNAGTLTIMMTETGLNRLEDHWRVDAGGTTDGSVSFQSYIDSSNAAFGQGTLLSDMGPFSNGFAAGEGGMLLESGPYSWTTVATITHSGGMQATSFDYNIKIPEPSSIALLGLGLFGIGFVATRRKGMKV